MDFEINTNKDDKNQKDVSLQIYTSPLLFSIIGLIIIYYLFFSALGVNKNSENKNTGLMLFEIILWS